MSSKLKVKHSFIQNDYVYVCMYVCMYVYILIVNHTYLIV